MREVQACIKGGAGIVQKDVIELLRARNRPMTASEVAHSLHTGFNTASRKLNQLVKYRFVRKDKKLVRVGAQYHRFYKYSLRSR